MNYRVYIIAINGKNRYVRAQTRTQAVMHAIDGVIGVSVATHDDLIDLMSRDAKIESASAPAQAPLVEAE